jgi:hypothetical protein
MAEGGWLLFVSRPTGYELREREGDPPRVGARVDVDGQALEITKVGHSPLPGDARRCAYALPAAS